MCITHDVDVPFKFYSVKNFIRTVVGDLVKRKSLYSFYSTIKYYFLSRVSYEYDPFFTFNYLLEYYQRTNKKAFFFFMAGGDTKQDGFYSLCDNRMRDLINKLRQSEHYIGFHPSYSTSNDSTKFNDEKSFLSNIVSSKIEYGRQHYLMFSLPNTWEVWDKAGMKWDSTMGYADEPGFRCGTCTEFSTFNILSRKKLGLKERPLIVMECTIFEKRYLNLNLDESFYEISKYIDKVRKYDGTFTLLWHNDRLETKEQRELFEKVLEY